MLAALVVLAFYLVLKYSDKIDAFIKSKFHIKGRKHNGEENEEK